MNENVAPEMADLCVGIVALSALESFLARMRENVLLEGESLFARIVALYAFERLLP